MAQQHVQALCQHLGELAKSLEHLGCPNPATDEQVAECLLQPGFYEGTSCYSALQAALCCHMHEALQPIALNPDASPEEAVRELRERAAQHVASADLTTSLLAQIQAALASDELPSGTPRHHACELPHMGPALEMEDVARLLDDLAHEPLRDEALSLLVADSHLLEDLCFGPSWPAFCARFGDVLVQAHRDGHPGGAAAAAGSGAGAGTGRLEACCGVLQQLQGVCCGGGSALHAADLLGVVLPALAAAPVWVTGLPADASPADILAAVEQQAAASAQLARHAHALLCSLAPEAHLLPAHMERLLAPICAALHSSLKPSQAAAQAAPRQLTLPLQLAPLELLWLLDDQLLWWRRLCAGACTAHHVGRLLAQQRTIPALELRLAGAGAAGQHTPPGVSAGCAAALAAGLLGAASPSLVGGADSAARVAHALARCFCVRPASVGPPARGGGGGAGEDPLWGLAALAGEALIDLAAGQVIGADSPAVQEVAEALAQIAADVSGTSTTPQVALARSTGATESWPAAAVKVLAAVACSSTALPSAGTLAATASSLGSLSAPLASGRAPCWAVGVLEFGIWAHAQSPDNAPLQAAVQSASSALADGISHAHSIKVGTGVANDPRVAPGADADAAAAVAAVASACWRNGVPLPAPLTRGSLLRLAADQLTQTYRSSAFPGERARAMRTASLAAASSRESMQALVEAGFGTAIMLQLAARLQHWSSGAAGSVAGSSAPPPAALAPLHLSEGGDDAAQEEVEHLKALLCWPGVVLGGTGGGGTRGDPDSGTTSVVAPQVLQLLQELVLWLDPGGGASQYGVMPAEAAAAALECFAALCECSTDAARVLDRTTNVRWYLEHCVVGPQMEVGPLAGDGRSMQQLAAAILAALGPGEGSGGDTRQGGRPEAWRQ